jgi:hypothetical protein
MYHHLSQWPLCPQARKSTSRRPGQPQNAETHIEVLEGSRELKSVDHSQDREDAVWARPEDDPPTFVLCLPTHRKTRRIPARLLQQTHDLGQHFETSVNVRNFRNDRGESARTVGTMERRTLDTVSDDGIDGIDDTNGFRRTLLSGTYRPSYQE